MLLFCWYLTLGTHDFGLYSVGPSAYHQEAGKGGAELLTRLSFLDSCVPTRLDRYLYNEIPS